MKYLEGEELTMRRDQGCTPQGYHCQRDRSGHCAAPLTRNKGVQKLLDAVVDYMPAPTDIAAIKGVNPETGEEEDRHVFR